MKVLPITFAVMPGSDDVVLFGVATMKALGLDLYPWALEKLRPSAVPVKTGVESPNFLTARRVTLPVESFQSEVEDNAPPDVAVECLVERGPDMFMDQMGERGTRDRALEDRVQQAVKARPRRYDPVKTGWLASCIVALGAFRLIVWNIQAVWALSLIHI